jgi:UDP-N-acetylglucosamine--N-acetylmuramyl-(pentapeptide) pyrophosphoryl-undecaprenol N-acetylglucosamine transferase
MTALFAGGGTGGHLFPALAIAGEMRRLYPECVIEFVGTRYGIEAMMKDQIGYPLHFVSVRGLPRSLSPALLVFPLRLFLAVVQALFLLRRLRPDVVIGTGGYVCYPILFAARLVRVPRVIQEQNSYPGLVTRKMARHAKAVFVGYDDARRHLPASASVVCTGNPIRREITGGDRQEAMKHFKLDPERKTILVLGGSQGAKRINDAVLQSLENLDAKYQVVWQCGKRNYTDVERELDKTDVVIFLFPFACDMKMVYAAADLAIARAGAVTIAELTACGIPSILVPYPYATGDHQTKNAETLAAAGAAVTIPDSELDSIRLLKTARELFESGAVSTMAEAARKYGRPEAAADIARRVIDITTREGDAVAH